MAQQEPQVEWAGFEVTEIGVGVVGAQVGQVSVELVTRHGKKRAKPTVIVCFGDLIVYCLDLAAVEGMAQLWDKARQSCPADLPQLLAADDNRHQAAILLRLQGKPAYRRVLGLNRTANPASIAAVLVSFDRVTMTAHDRDAVESLADLWQSALAEARELWPDLETKPRHMLTPTDLLRKAGFEFADD